MMNADDVITRARYLADRMPHEEDAKIIEALLALANQQAATIARVRAIVTGGEQREATSLTRMFNGDPFPALFTTADIRAALDGEDDQ